MELTDGEARVLGCLIEKEMTTPDYYPMTINSLASACNQKSNRSPVVDYTDTEVTEAVDSLRHRGLARTVHGKGDRSLKYKHVAGEILKITRRQTALLAVLLLRGEQTLGELRNRTGRYVEFADLDDVAVELASLAAAEEPRAEMLMRRPGEKESRYRHLLGAAGVETEQSDFPLADEGDEDHGRVAELESELAVLRDRVTRMERELGLD
ncbi:MAG: YceH family protein [Acidimicrobiia bacterium]|nr:YceH family protein [Acidimicrobiia bacterium]MDX2468437.1 YceH family protein [Acidimicrobiia bacterium]